MLFRSVAHEFLVEDDTVSVRVYESADSEASFAEDVRYAGDCPPPPVVEPTAALSIECLVDSDYEVKFGIEAGSEDAEYILRLREGNGMLTDGTVAAEGDYSEAVIATLDEGMIVVLRINGERIKSVVVPAACPEPVEPPTTTVPPVEPPAPPVEPPVTTVVVTEAPEEEPPLEVRQSLGPAQEPPLGVRQSLGPAQEALPLELPATGTGSDPAKFGAGAALAGVVLWALGKRRPTGRAST